MASIVTFKTDTKEVYFPRTSTYSEMYEQNSKGAIEHLRSIRVNRETGFISHEEVETARLMANKLERNSKSLGFNWTPKGPDDVGGRTRAIIVDINDTSHIYAGAVSGGIWESFDAAVTWQPYDPDFKISNVSSMAQGPDGAIYVGTGSTFDGTFNNKAKSSHFVGTGLYRLTGNGGSELLQGPAIDNSFGTSWTAVNDIIVNPNDKDHIFAAINNGLMVSKNGGETWARALLSSSSFQDLEFTSDNKVFATSNGNVQVSDDGGESFTSRNFSNGGRVEVAVAPSNTNIVYALLATPFGCTAGVSRSMDGGFTWSDIDFVPDIFGPNCQGDYDSEIIVYPNNPGRFIAGGIGLFQWVQTSIDPAPVQGEWKSIAVSGKIEGAENRLYVHADKHKFVFNPENPNTLYFGSDGGVSVTFNASDEQPLYSESNLGYNVTQFYDIGAGPNGQVIGGTQDNGSPMVGFPFNSGRSSVEPFGGDGFDAHLSTIDPELGLVSSQFGTFARLQGLGATILGSNFNTAGVASEQLQELCFGPAGRPSCSQVFYTSLGFWESFKHEATKDSVTVSLSRTHIPPMPRGTKINYTSKNNDWPMQDTLREHLFPTDTLSGKLDSLEIEINSNGIHEFRVNFDTISIDTNTKQIRVGRRAQTPVTFNYNVNEKVSWANIFGGAGLPLSVTVTDTSIKYSQLQLSFIYEAEFSDSIQSMANIANVRGRLTDAERNIWMTRDLLKGSNTSVIRWFKIAGASSRPDVLLNSDDVISNEYTRDGNSLFVGTRSGNLYRIDNLNDIDVSQIPPFTELTDDDYVVDNITECHFLRSFANRSITGIAIDPQDGNNVIITLGNYGNLNHVFRSTNALDTNATFTSIDGFGTGRLPITPVYDAVVDFRDHNVVVLATELGIYATENAFDPSASNVAWTEENAGMGRAPAMSIQQTIFGFEYNATNQGLIYVGTHGRGIYETNRLVGIDDEIADDVDNEVREGTLNIYPNPVKDYVKIEFKSNNSPSNVNLSLYNIRGQLVYERVISASNTQKSLIDLDLSNLENGTYLVRLVSGDNVSSGKLIKN